MDFLNVIVNISVKFLVHDTTVNCFFYLKNFKIKFTLDRKFLCIGIQTLIYKHIILFIIHYIALIFSDTKFHSENLKVCL